MTSARPEREYASRTAHPLRIAICLQDLGALHDMLATGHAVDGTYVVQGYIADRLQRRGHAVTFVAPRGLDDVECGPDPDRPSPVRRTWTATPWFNVASRAAWRAQRLVGVPYLNLFSNYRLLDACLQCLPGHDVVYERNAMYSVGVARACERIGIPYVMFFEADQLVELEYAGRPVTGLLRWRAERILRANLALAARVICVSDAARAQLIARWGVDASKVVVCPNGVDTDRFRPAADRGAGVRSSLGLGTEPLIAFVGSFCDWHDVPTLLDAFVLVRARRPEARLVLVGDGPTRPAMEARALELDLASVTRFTGLVGHAEVPAIIAAADVAVAPYPVLDRELWHSPLKVYEYLAAGTAVVASGTGQVAQAVRDERNGLLVPPGDARALSASLVRLIDDPGLRRQLGRQARQDAVTRHSWDHYVEHLESVFAEAMR